MATSPEDQSIKDLRFSVVDVETTGLSPSADRIVEVAVVGVTVSDGITSRFTTLLNPERDVGPTHIHGISADLVIEAPKFHEVAGDIADQLVNVIWTGHQVAFDTRFLRTEFGRAGFDLPAPLRLCTLALSRRLLPNLAGYRLAWVCSEAGIDLEEAHCALSDAEATATLLLRFLEMARQTGLTTIGEMYAWISSFTEGALMTEAPSTLHRCGRCLVRDAARTAATKARATFVRELVQRLDPPNAATDVSDSDTSLYLAMLDRMLEDRILDASEREQLTSLACEWSFDSEVIHRAHQTYLRWLIDAALEDFVVTPVELEDLHRVSEMLSIPRTTLDQLMKERQELLVRSGKVDSTPLTTSRRPVRLDKIRGKSVCFTGVLNGPRGGGCTRADAEDLARNCGLEIKKSVTKHLDLLVLRDGLSQSSKAKKARRYGITIKDEHVFWRELGLA